MASTTAQAQTVPKLRVGDVVSVNVVDEPAISGDYPISAAGTFQMPYLDTPVPAVGKTPQLLAETVIELLKPDYILNPQVIVRMVNKNAHTCTVLGQVRNPRTIPFDPDEGMTLQGALGRAGDTTPMADLRGIEVTRGGTTFSAPMPESKAVKLKDGDTVNVPSLAPAGTYQLTGHAKRAGVYEIPRGESHSVLWAIMNGGGIADTGKLRGTTLRRNGETIEFKREEDLDAEMIRPGDIIEIDRRTF